MHLNVLVDDDGVGAGGDDDDDDDEVFLSAFEWRP